MKNIPLLLGTIVGTVVLIIVVAFMFSGDSGSQQTSTEPVPQEILLEGARHPYSSTQETTIAENVGENQATESGENVLERITIVEFSDFQCPACKAALPAVEAVKAAFPGQIEMYYRHFPLDSIHPNARTAALASEAAAATQPENSQVFWDFHDKLFAEQQSWSNIRSRDELTDTFATYAEELGIDRNEFLEKMEDDSLAGLVNQDYALGTQLGITGTPTFYVNGVKTSAPQLITTVETLLNK